MAGKENYVTTVHLIQDASMAAATHPGNVTANRNGVVSYVIKVCIVNISWSRDKTLGQ